MPRWKHPVHDAQLRWPIHASPAAGVTLDYHATIMLPWGEEALKAVDAAEKGELGPFVLVMEGSIPDESIAKKTGIVNRYNFR